MSTSIDTKQKPAPKIVWWIIWASILIGFVTIYNVIGSRPTKTSPTGLINYIGLVPLVISVYIRLILMPKEIVREKLFVKFIIGVVLAEACGIFGTFLGGEMKEASAIIATIAIICYIPLFEIKSG